MTRRVRIKLSALSTTQHETYRRVLDTLKLMREHKRYSLARSSKESGTSAATVRRYAASALQTRRGKHRIRDSDRLRRELLFYTSTGKMILVTHSSRQATEIAKYHNAVKAFVSHGDFGALGDFQNKSIVVNGKRHEYLTDTRILNRLARAGELSVHEIYTSVGVN